MVEIKTVFNETHSWAMTKLTIKNSILFMAVFTFLLIIIGIALIGIDSDNIFGIILIIFGIVIIPIWLLSVYFMQKKLNKSNKITQLKPTNCFVFDETGLHTDTQQINGLRSTGDLPYSMLFKAVRTKDYFFVYISNMQAFVMPVKDIISGTAEELGQILKANLPPKKYKSNIK